MYKYEREKISVQNYCQLVHRTPQNTYQSIKEDYNTCNTSVYIKKETRIDQSTSVIIVLQQCTLRTLGHIKVYQGTPK